MTSNVARAAPEQAGNGPQLSSSAADFQPNSPIQAPAQVTNPRAVREAKLELLREFNLEIVQDLIASGWRVGASLLTHAAKFIEADDFLGAEHNRQRAREQINETNDLFRQFQEAERVAGFLREGPP